VDIYARRRCARRFAAAAHADADVVGIRREQVLGYSAAPLGP
jgi:hypothetical protein